MTAEEERRLISQVLKGDSGAFEHLVKANEKVVYSLAYRMTGSREDALDVSQESFLKAYTNLNTFRGGSKFSVWLYRLTYNACTDFLRKNRRHVTLSLSGVEEDSPEADIPDSQPLPEESAEREETREQVRQAVMSLDEDKREVILMREFSGMDYAAIARTLDISEGTVKSRISRARHALAKLLKESGTFSCAAASKDSDRKGGASRG